MTPGRRSSRARLGRLILAVALPAGALGSGVVGAACSSGASGPVLILDGRPHPADTAGVVTAVDLGHVELDGKRTYPVDRDRLEVFVSNTLAAASLLGSENRYALLGLRGATVEWMELLSVVVRLPGAPPSVLYAGNLVRTEGSGREGRLVFSDGTVLDADLSALRVPATHDGPVPVQVDIDPATHRVSTLVQA